VASTLGGMTVLNGKVLFAGTDAAGNRGLWVTNGTASGTHELTGISGADVAGIDPANFAVLGQEVVFRGFDNLAAVAFQQINTTQQVGNADAFAFSADLGSGTIRDSNVHDATIQLVSPELADVAAELADAHQLGANAVIAPDDVLLHDLHAQNFHLV
jgi:ELWxxDGT repeat protein